MATAQSLLDDWAGEDGERYEVLHKNLGLVLGWINQAQLRFCDISEVLRAVWEPIISSDGVVPLPDDFLREAPHRVKWTTNINLSKIDYPSASLGSFSTTTLYSIWGGKFYVWGPGSGTPSIPYVKKPADITKQSLPTDDLEIPTEYHVHLILYLEAKYQQRLGNYSNYLALIKEFTSETRNSGVRFMLRNDPVPFMQGGSL